MLVHKKSLVLLVLLLNSAHGKDTHMEHNIDKQLDACLASEEGQSGYGMKKCLADASAAWDDELNKNYKQLMSILSAEQKKQLKSAQRAWIKYRDKDIEYLASTLDSMTTGYTIFLSNRDIELTKQRALTLAQYYQDFNN